MATVKIGIVSAIDEDSMTARVYFPDHSDMVSGWLYVLQRPGEALTTDTADGHRHTGYVKSWMPAVNDKVLAIYPGGFDMDGYVLGVIP